MRKLVPIEQLLEQAEQDGLDTSHMLVDPDDVCSINPDELDLDSDQDD